jgi:hypothetical protein
MLNYLYKRYKLPIYMTENVSPVAPILNSRLTR